MLITAYLVSVNALSFTMHAEDKAASNGLLPFLGRIPGMTESWSERGVWRNIVIEYFHAFGQSRAFTPVLLLWKINWPTSGVGAVCRYVEILKHIQ